MATLESRMTHIAGFGRDQLLLLPEAVDDYVEADNPVRFIEELVVRQPQAPAGLRRDQAKHETIASGSHGGTHTVRLYYNPLQYICN